MSTAEPATFEGLTSTSAYTNAHFPPRGRGEYISPRPAKFRGLPLLWSNTVIHPDMNLDYVRFVLAQVRLTSSHVRLVIDTDSNVGAHEPPSTEYVYQWAYDTAPLLAGSIHVLTLRGVVPTWNMPECYASLTVLFLSNIGNPLHRTTVRALLCASPALVTLEISNVLFQTQYYSDEVVDMTNMVLPSLAHLKLAFGLNPPLNIPTALVAPVLESIHLQSDTICQWTEIEGLCLDYLRVVQTFSMKQKVLDYTALNCLQHLHVAAIIDIGRCPPLFVDAVSRSAWVDAPCRKEWGRATEHSNGIVYELVDPDSNGVLQYRRIRSFGKAGLQIGNWIQTRFNHRKVSRIFPKADKIYFEWSHVTAYTDGTVWRYYNSD
ncbi:hypothetical protein R3P38DRAFT_2775083 [Favolaschia claudopus]|uniref:F-box domain-containing protein n=1 Tax=Favolaschia claudopus TaxID=2862362 RepID=A0AAW0BVQ9_9AGAR